MRVQAAVAAVLATLVACSSPDRARSVSPTAPSQQTGGAFSPMDTRGISGPMDVLFPSRVDAYDFRIQLETKYETGLNRAASSTYVDREGEVVWVQEYIRYRVNGCDHTTAISRVMTQIDGGAPGGICEMYREFVVVFPARDQILDFRQQLETKYQQMGRSLISTFVDLEGSVIWLQEYLRYRTNECDHASATQKTFSQIDGGPVSDTCVPACRYRVAPGSRDLGGESQNTSVDLVGEPGGCNWTVTSDASWLTFSSDVASGNRGINVPYSVTQNVSGGPRTGRLTFAFDGGTATHTVFQEGSAFITQFTLTDPFRAGTSSTTECHFRSSSTPCTLTATSNLPGGGAYTYSWTVKYTYGTDKTVTGTASSLTFNDACGGGGATAEGNLADLNVTLTITDSQGNTQTISSGSGQQAQLFIKRFTC